MISLRSEKSGEGFKFRIFVISVKYSFNALANKGSSEISLSFLISICLFEFSLSLLKKGLIVFQNFFIITNILDTNLIFQNKIF